MRPTLSLHTVDSEWKNLEGKGVRRKEEEMNFNCTQTSYLEVRFKRDLLHTREGRQYVPIVFTNEDLL